jgi:K+-sensing histidine kinase KdpD
MQSTRRKWVLPSRCSSPLKWIYAKSRFAYWEGGEGDESLVFEVRSRWFGFEFSDKCNESEIRFRHRISIRLLLRSLCGALLCGTSAIMAVYLFRDYSFSLDVPLWFIAVLLGTAVLCGRVAGIVGSILATITFMFFLFAPFGSLAVNDSAARTNLGCMLLAGFAISCFAPKRNLGSASTD